jgi:ornithine cyclodeaminase
MADPAQPIWISEADVVASLNVRDAIAAVERGLTAEAEGTSRSMLKTHVKWGAGNTLHALGAADTAAGMVGTKTWAHTAGGATPLLLLFDANGGALRAVIEAFALGQLRTAAVSGVATRWLAREDASALAIVGSGRQALGQVAAVLAVRPGCSVRVFSPTATRRTAFAARVRDGFGIETMAAASVEEAVAGAAIVTLVTRAREPFLHAAMLATGAHVNAIGAITPDRVEFSADVFARCGIVAADSVPAAQHLSREFQEHFGNDWSKVVSLSHIVADAFLRPAGVDLTLFKAMGLGTADLAVGIEVFERARRTGRGRPIAHPMKVEIDWRLR